MTSHTFVGWQLSETLIDHEQLRDFVIALMKKLGAPEDTSICVADNLVTSNLRGIDSHGVGRLKRYVTGIREGYIVPDAKVDTVIENAVLANVNGNHALGQAVGVYSMSLAIHKALSEGIGVVTAFNSNHYGFAGYYAMMALDQGFIGISMTNSEPLVVPTFGRNAKLGTNPIAMAVPASENNSWVMDQATSVVPSGKLQVYERAGEEIPEGWATDETGHSTTDPTRVLQNLYGGTGEGGILPLGGEGEIHGGHKGYGFATMVDILCGVLSGANYADDVVWSIDNGIKHPNVGHFFLAMDPSFFGDLENFKSRMDDMIERLHQSEKADGETRIFVHGEKEFEEHERREKTGIPLDARTIESLEQFAEEFNIDLEFKE
ncbi:Ldh family oxidoreductase [Candidatus Thorarchaeota archaeon]|nr:MAG: Ldh family oxidoreductase [Candidatus Thorarchaeota archaeon]